MEVMLTRPLGDCFKAQQALVNAANELARRLQGVHPEADLLRLGAMCIRLGAERALQAREPQVAIRSWRECYLGEKQIRLITYRALRDRCIDIRTYDAMFRLAALAARIREDERQRLRRKMQYLNIV
jgi:hypothetical protein